MAQRHGCGRGACRPDKRRELHLLFRLASLLRRRPHLRQISGHQVEHRQPLSGLHATRHSLENRSPRGRLRCHRLRYRYERQDRTRGRAGLVRRPDRAISPHERTGGRQTAGGDLRGLRPAARLHGDLAQGAGADSEISQPHAAPDGRRSGRSAAFVGQRQRTRRPPRNQPGEPVLELGGPSEPNLRSISFVFAGRGRSRKHDCLGGHALPPAWVGQCRHRCLRPRRRLEPRRRHLPRLHGLRPPVATDLPHRAPVERILRERVGCRNRYRHRAQHLLWNGHDDRRRAGNRGVQNGSYPAMVPAEPRSSVSRSARQGSPCRRTSPLLEHPRAG